MSDQTVTAPTMSGPNAMATLAERLATALERAAGGAMLPLQRRRT